MFAKQNALAPADRSVGTIIGEGVVVEAGSLKGSGSVRIDGWFSGTIALDGHLVIGATGAVKGEVRAKSAMCAGSCQGDIYIDGTFHLAPRSRVEGQVECGKMIMDEDAFFAGQCNMDKSHKAIPEPHQRELPEPEEIRL